MYDYIIIGGGISGLYMSAKLSSKYKTLLLEKNNYLGGRAIQTKFHGENIKLGAGIAAPDNKYLLKLLNRYNINYNTYDAKINLQFNTTFNMNDAIKKIIKKYKELKKENNNDIYTLDVEHFIKKYFSVDFFNQYNKIAEYKDYLKSDLTYYIKYYPITDHNPTPYKLISLQWTDLINNLHRYIKKNNVEIKLNINVDNIIYDKNNKHFIINNKYTTKNIIFAITINSLNNIINQTKIINIDYNKFIGSVQFLRIYTYHKNGHKLNIDRYSIIDNKLEKIIIISDKILMISYSDNNNAEYWYKLYNENKEKLINTLIKLCKKSTGQDITIDDIEFAYWKEGIHYFHPTKNDTLKNIINKLSNPIDNIYVIGEMLSYRQGWVEGAVESVERVYNMIK
jgi:protoporphyrinogen oxidase